MACLLCLPLNLTARATLRRHDGYQLGSPEADPNRQENVMKKIRVIAATLVGAAVLCAAPMSLHLSQDKGLSLSVDKARAYRHSAAQAGTAAGQLTCRDAAKLQFPNERKMRKAFKKECKEAYKASRATAAHS